MAAQERRVMFQNNIILRPPGVAAQDLCSALQNRYAGCNEQDTSFIPELRIRVCVADMKLHARGASVGMLDIMRDPYTFLKVEMMKSRLELSVIKGGKEGKSMIEVSNLYLGQC